MAPALGVTLNRVDSTSIRIDSVGSFSTGISVLLMGRDSILVGCCSGIYLLRTDSNICRQIMECAKEGPDWYPDCYKKEQFDKLFEPSRLWRQPQKGTVVLYDDYCKIMLVLENLGSAEPLAKMWKNSYDLNYGSRVNIQDNLIFSQRFFEDGTNMLTVQGVDDNKAPRNVFQIGQERMAKLEESSGFNKTPLYRAAFNPTDSTIWVNVWGSSSLYVVDFSGTVIDSLFVDSKDWIPPGQPVSRIRTRAVYNEWVSRWTPPTDFQYVEPGYFILQFRTGWQETLGDSIPLYSNVAWNVNRTREELKMDNRLQLAGMHPDGEMACAYYDTKHDSLRV
ncbi:MAG: hypothetical protein AAB305_03820, partial [Candidatus Zixiibacteriota bacterium]